jgi:diguanylate cyclase (GGDEF)-like protein/PAS domain S-box-containing protein
MQSSIPFFSAWSSDEASNLLKQALDNLVDGVYFTDRSRTITYWNQAAERLSGYSAAEVIGKCCADRLLRHVDDLGNQLCEGECPVSRSMTHVRSQRAEVYLHHKGGYRLPVEVRVCPLRGSDGEVVGAVEIFSDNSRNHAVRERAKELAKWAFLDPASQLGNRRYLERQLSQHFDQHSKGGTPFAIVLADVDEFKSINDTYGHAVGDAALLTVAKTLSGGLRSSDVIGRWGGDEFLAILPGVTHEGLATASEKCRTLVAQSSVAANGKQIPVTVSMGAAMASPGDSPASLLKRADQRLYASKQKGRNQVSL